MADTVHITNGSYRLDLHRAALTKLYLGPLRKIIKLMLRASWENESAIHIFYSWLQEDVSDAQQIAADVKRELDDYWHPGLVEDVKVRRLRRELKAAERNLERAQKLLTYFLTERTKYYGNYD